ncbi:MAG TPA: hypothetical protein VKP64_14110 [Mycobacteriales bacterium]|nr:hypothetical protein [Mycobacteriales bacterium]
MTSEQTPQRDPRTSADEPARIDDRVSPDAPGVPAANQGKADPMPPTGDRGGEPGSRVADTNEVTGEERQREPRPAAAPFVGAGVPAPGDVAGVGVNAPAVHAAQGTSEETEPVTLLTNANTSLPPTGKPDGEVDTRPR